MDIFAHGLWSGAIYTKRTLWAVLWGILPDLLSFGILFGFFLVTRGTVPFSGDGPPPLSALPPFVFNLYNLTHSLIIWAVLFGLTGAYLKRIPWEFTAWALHIVIDIPTHTTAFFPTPFLWPLPQPFINGISWGTPWFMAVNYGALLLTYTLLLWQKRKSN